MRSIDMQLPPPTRRAVRPQLLAVLCIGVAHALSGAVAAEEALATIDRFVSHVSTVPANEGQRVGLFVREKIGTTLEASIAAGAAPEGRVVLFVHGVSIPSVPDFDLGFKDYSWMAYLAAAGFDTFAMDHTGYGYSPMPAMDNPCNMSAADQAVVIPNPLGASCEPDYKHLLTTSATDWDEIDTVVDYIRGLRGVERVSLIAWSLGGLRTGGYAARHPDKIDKLVLFAPFYQPESPTEPPASLPSPGVPMTLQTRAGLMHDRWGANVACEDQVEPGIQDTVWRTIMSYDAFGSVWGPADGVMRVRTAEYFGWNPEFAARVTAPTLIMVGRQDGLLPGGQALYRDLAGADSKVIVEMECATHFALWETSQYRFMHEASKEWLLSDAYRGEHNGSFVVGSRARAQ
jgi:pimeloyl-ACP methyl ester carboxylesterase